MNDDVESAYIENPSAYPESIQAGIPKLGGTPNGWTRFSLGDLIRKVERPAKLVNTESYQLVTAKRNRGGIVAREVLRGDQIRTKTQFYVETGDFLISNRQISHGACGVVPASLNGSVVSNEYPTALRAELIGIIRKRYSDFGPTLLKRPRRSMRHVHASRSGPVHFHQPFLAPKTEFNGVGGLRTHIRPVPICGTFQKL
jgi:hypothetical protein